MSGTVSTLNSFGVPVLPFGSGGGVGLLMPKLKHRFQVTFTTTTAPDHTYAFTTNAIGSNEVLTSPFPENLVIFSLTLSTIPK